MLLAILALWSGLWSSLVQNVVEVAEAVTNGGAVFDFGLLGAALVNSVLVLAGVQGLTWALPVIKARFPWAIPLIAFAAGPLLALATTALTGFFGHPIDLGALLALLTGGTAVTMHQFLKQLSPAKRVA